MGVFFLDTLWPQHGDPRWGRQTTHQRQRTEMAQILVVKYESQADAKVFEAHYESQADLAVFEVPYEQQATGDAVWHLVNYESQATFKIFKVRYEAQADLRIFKVKYLEQAGWRTQNHKLQGALGK